jgi:hypothetical protein
MIAEELDWGGIAQFHQIYMPTREILRNAVRQIRALTPSVKIIAPQHGHVITGDLVPLFLDWMEQLFVGYDLLPLELDNLYARQYGDLVEVIIAEAVAALGERHVNELLEASDVDDELHQCLSRKTSGWRVRRAPYACAAMIFRRVTRGKGNMFANALRSRTLKFCCEQGVPVPAIGWGMEGSDAGVSA